MQFDYRHAPIPFTRALQPLRIRLVFAVLCLAGLGAGATAASEVESMPSISPVFVEEFGGGPGFRFKIRNVSIDGQSNAIHAVKGGVYGVSLDLLQDCDACGNAINQIIVGLAGEEKAQVSVWNGKQRSGGDVRIVNHGTPAQVLAEDNGGPAEWVNVQFQIVVPERSGTYFLRARYAQDYRGNLMTAKGRKIPQPVYQEPLGWWKVDRPQGPASLSNIGVIVVQ